MGEDIVWIVGKTYPDCDKSWSFEGVFYTEEEAVKHCTDWYHWVGPAKMNEFVGGEFEDREWPDGYYPLAEKEKGDN